MLAGWAERKKSGPRSLGRDHQSGPKTLGRDHRGPRSHVSEPVTIRIIGLCSPLTIIIQIQDLKKEGAWMVWRAGRI